MTLKYTTHAGFVDYLLGTKNSFGNDRQQIPSWETLARDGSTNTYYFANKGVITGTVSLIYSDLSTQTALTETTDYTIDYELCCITLTAGGVTKVNGGEVLAKYNYWELGFSKAQVEGWLATAEDKIERACMTVFTNQTSNPAYKQITDEVAEGRGYIDNTYEPVFYPLVKLATTTNGAYTTGASTITLTDATEFPTTGTIYIGGNKVTYTGKTGNVLTIPTTTPSIATAAIVRGEVVEISTDSAGFTPTFLVLQPDIDYSVDYDSGNIQLQKTEYLYQGTINTTRPEDGVFNRFRTSYLNAYRLPQQKCYVPAEIVEVTYMIAADFFRIKTINKNIVTLNSNVNLSGIRYSDEKMQEIIDSHKLMRISRC